MEGQGDMDVEIATQHKVSIQNIPEDAFSEILSFLPAKDIMTCRLVSRSWRDDLAIQEFLRTSHKSIHFRRITDIKYFEWLMRTTPGARIPFSKFTFHVDQDIAPIDIENFMNSSNERTGLAFEFKVKKHVTFRPLEWNMESSPFWGIDDYAASVHKVLLCTSNLTSLSFIVDYQLEFPVSNDTTYIQAFGNLRKFKVKFLLVDYASVLLQREDAADQEITLFEKVIKYSPRLKVLSLLYYPYFCRVDYDYPDMPVDRMGIALANYADYTMRTRYLRKLPDFLSLLHSPSTKVKLRLGIVTDRFQDVWNRLVALDPQPRIVALAISLPTELDKTLRTSIWNGIQALPLKKLKFFEDRPHYDDIPALPTATFQNLRQLRLTSVQNITSNGGRLLFPNLKKLSVCLSDTEDDGRTVYPDFDGFCSLVAGVPRLEHLKLTGNPWEVVTGQPYSIELCEVVQDYVVDLVDLKQLEDRVTGITKNPIRELKNLKSLELKLTPDDMYCVLFASVTGRLQRLSHIIFAKHDDDLTRDGITRHPSELDGSAAASIIRNYHDKISFLGGHRI